MTYIALGPDVTPEARPDYDNLGKEPTARVALRIDLRGDVFRQRFAYPVIVELWDTKNSGSRKRNWLKTFTEAERKRIAAWHTKFRKWHLQTGTPDRVLMDTATFGLLERALNFFGTM